MAKPASPQKQKHLKIYTEQPPKDARPQIEAVACLPDLQRAFQAATGSELKYESGSLRLETKAETKQAANTERRSSSPQSLIPSPSSIKKLAGTIGDLLGELLETRRVLWRREAELAAGVPLIPHREGEIHLAARLEAALRAGAEAVDCDAVALYMLDEATTKLKLRSCWGLPFDRLAAEPRPLEGALADLEALLGHAVVLNDEHTMQMWSVPEDFPTAVCVPVSTPTVLLGTMWFFSNQRRDFTDRQTNILEVVAGRVAADLEREMLLRVGSDGAKLQKQVAAAERLQRNELPTVAPMLDGWEIAGWTAQAENLGGAFHDWFCLPRGLLAVGVGKAAQQGVAGAMTANVVKTAFRAHARYHRHSERILQQVNLTLWTGSAGDQQASLFSGLIETATGRVCCASAGQISGLLIRADGWESLGSSAACLGVGAETDFDQFGHELQPGETMIVFSDSLRGASDGSGRVLSDADLAAIVQSKLQLSADELLAAVREAIEIAGTAAGRDMAVLVVKRTTA